MSDFTKKIEEAADVRSRLNYYVDDKARLDFIAGAQKALEILASGEWYRTFNLIADDDNFTELSVSPFKADVIKPELLKYRTIQIEALASLAAKLELANAEIAELKEYYSMSEKTKIILAKRSNEKQEAIEKLTEKVTILLDDADFFSGDVRKLTAFENLKQLVKYKSSKEQGRG